jgi:hypothetical protein
MKNFSDLTALTITIVLSIAWLSNSSQTIDKRNSLAGSSLNGVSGVRNGRASIQKDPEDRFAWDEFRSLVHPFAISSSVLSSQPEWVSWKNKCKAGLIANCPSLPGRQPNHPADQTSAEIPGQVLAGFMRIQPENERNQFVLKYGKAPELDSVLFNARAAASIRKGHLGRRSALDLVVRRLDATAISGPDRKLPAGTFAIGSEIIKLIWEIIPDTKGQYLPLYDPVNIPIISGSLRLSTEDDWQARYAIDRDESKPCPTALPPYGSAETAPTVPIRCFYWFPIKKEDPCESFSRDIQVVWCQPDFKKQDFIVILVGFHVMKLTPTNPNWKWMTFYWTRENNDVESNGARWNAPWNHFHAMTTTSIREYSTSGHSICFNPYLEGHDTNGLKANCLSCHSFAAYSPKGSKVKDGTAYGSNYPYSKEQRATDEGRFFMDSVQTSFIWSVSTSQDAVDSHLIDSFRTILESVLLDQIKSQ